MELQAKFHGVGVSAFGDVEGCGTSGTSATLGVRRLVRRYGQRGDWLETHDRRDVDDHIDEAAGQEWDRGHEESKPRVIVASWNAESIGPRIIAAPQRGQDHVSTVGASVVVGAGAGATAVRPAPRRPRARATRVVRHV